MVPEPRRWSAVSSRFRAPCCSVFGIIFLIAAIILGIIAIVTGRKELAAIRAGLAPASGQSIATAGTICGIVGISLAVLMVLVIIGIIVFAVAMDNGNNF